MTGHGDIPMSVKAMKGGAVDFLTKPFRDQDMLDAVMRAIERDRKRREADKDSRDLAGAVRDSDTSRAGDFCVGIVRPHEQADQPAELGLAEITVRSIGGIS